MGFDEGVLQSDMLQSPSITHWPSPCADDHPKVSVKTWEVQRAPSSTIGRCNSA
jgi:hypothetical protein